MRRVWLVAAVVPAATLAQTGPPEREGNPVERAEAMWRERAYPFPETFRSAVEAARATAARLGGGAGISAVVAPWRSLGPFGFQANGFFGSSPQADGGRIVSIAVHPRNPSVYYAGSGSGGVWKTTNGGASWTPLTDSQCSLTTGAIALDPVDPTIVYVGTGEPTQSNGCGLLRSFDGGTTWTETNGGGVLAPTTGLGTQTFRIVVDPTTAGSRTSSVVLDATSTGLHRSANSGTTWSTVLSGRVTDVRIDPTQLDVYWAAVSNDNARGGIYRSTDRGGTWQRVYDSPAGNGRTTLALSRAAPRKVWAAISVSSSNRLGSLVLYDDAASSGIVKNAAGLYNVTTRGDFGAQASYDLVLEADPTDANTIYLGGVRMYRSRDGGQTFSVVAYTTHVDWHALEFAPSDPTVIIGGNDGGVHVSYNSGDTWLSRNTNIAVTQYYAGLAAHPTIADVLVGGLQDNSSLFAFGSAYWTYVSGGDGGAAAFNPLNPNFFWSTCQNVGCIFRTTRAASGNGLSVVSRGFSATDRKRFLPPIVVDPNLPTTLYYGTYRLYATTTEGQFGSWTPITIDLTKGTGVINSVAIAPSDSRIIWVGTSDGNVQVSTDGATTFTPLAAGLPNRSVTDIVLDPMDVRRALITLSGFGTPHVYLTTDQGATWQSISGNLPDLPFNGGVIIPGTNRFFVGGDIGIYETTNAGATWTAAFPGMPNVIVTDLVYQQATGNLYAATYGRGIYATALQTGSAVLRGDVNRDGLVNAFDALLVQQALVGVPSGSQNPMPAGDANCNGRLDAGDALAILQFAVGSASSALCVGTTR